MIGAIAIGIGEHTRPRGDCPASTPDNPSTMTVVTFAAALSMIIIDSPVGRPKPVLGATPSTTPGTARMFAS